MDNEKPSMESHRGSPESKSISPDRRSLKLVIRLPSKGKKASIEVKDQEQKIKKEKVQSVGSSSPDRSVRAEKIEEVQDGPESVGKDCNKESRSSRFSIKSQETKDDQEELPMAKKVFEETKADQEEEKILENKEIRGEGKKMGALNDQKRKKVRPVEAETKEKRKRGFTVALSTEQIEEDIRELLGSNPLSRRPKKKSKTSQQRLKNLFPGAWMEFLIALDEDKLC